MGWLPKQILRIQTPLYLLVAQSLGKDAIFKALGFYVTRVGNVQRRFGASHKPMDCARHTLLEAGLSSVIK